MTAATTVTNAEETKVWGVWTPDEFKDALVFAIVTSCITFALTLFYKWLGKYLEIR